MLIGAEPIEGDSNVSETFPLPIKADFSRFLKGSIAFAIYSQFNKR